jgi:hypothetical protein
MTTVDLTDRHATLAQPLGWAFSQFLPVASAHPALGLRLLTAERPRLHFLAFVLAMTSRTITAEAIDHALGKSMREVLADMGLCEVRGLRRLLGRIAGSVMEREHYRLLASLLVKPTAASVLHHATEVSGALLENIRDLPSAMRSPVIVQAIAHMEGAALHVLQWIDIVAARLQRSSQDIQRQVGRCASLGELRTELNKLLDALPALEAAPPKTVEAAARVDTPSAIRQLGKRFHNCLADFVDAEVDGTTHIYHWRCSRNEAVCEVTRVGNLGWFLGCHLGPDNDALPEDSARQIRVAFAAVDIHLLKIVETYDDLYFSTGGREQAFDSDNRRSRHHRHGRYHAD